jgi:hypothetical protein
MRRAARRLLLADAETQDGDGSLPGAGERFPGYPPGNMGIRSILPDLSQ